MSVDLKLFAAHTEAAAWLTVPAEEWMASGLCAQADAQAWFPETSNNHQVPKRICRGCPVRDDCLSFALAHDEQFGIWGGHDTAERNRLQKGQPARRPRKAPVPRNANGHGWSCKCTRCLAGAA